jgi:hypothetical protein
MNSSSHRSLLEWPTNHNRAICHHEPEQIDRGCIGQIVSRSNSTKAEMPSAQIIILRRHSRGCDKDCLGDLDNDLKLSQGQSRRGGGAR